MSHCQCRLKLQSMQHQPNSSRTCTVHLDAHATVTADFDSLCTACTGSLRSALMSSTLTAAACWSAYAQREWYLRTVTSLTGPLVTPTFEGHTISRCSKGTTNWLVYTLKRVQGHAVSNMQAAAHCFAYCHCVVRTCAQVITLTRKLERQCGYCSSV